MIRPYFKNIFGYLIHILNENKSRHTLLLKAVWQLGHDFIFEIDYSRLVNANACGTVGTAVAFDTRDPLFKSSHWHFLFTDVICLENEEKEGQRTAHFCSPRECSRYNQLFVFVRRKCYYILSLPTIVCVCVNIITCVDCIRCLQIMWFCCCCPFRSR